MNSFLIISRNIFSKNKYRNKLTNDDIVAYILLGDRFKVSLKNRWFDHKIKAPFINYKIKDLAHDLRVGKTKAVRILKDLEKVGLIKKRRMFKQSNRLFLPKFTFRSHINSKIKKQNNNKSNNNKESDSKSDIRVKENRNRWQNTNIKKYDDKLDHQNMIKVIKYQRLPKPLVKHIHKLFNGITLYKCIHVLLQAKASIIKDHHGSKLVKQAMNFDINDYYTYNNSHNFIEYIDHGLRKAWHNASKLWSYFMTVCKHYYNYALKWFIQNTHTKNTNGPRIPIFKI